MDGCAGLSRGVCVIERQTSALDVVQQGLGSVVTLVTLEQRGALSHQPQRMYWVPVAACRPCKSCGCEGVKADMTYAGEVTDVMASGSG